MRIAVLGLGRMGAPMARNLAEVGHQVTLYNRTPARALELDSSVGRVAPTVAEAVLDAQVALTMVTGDVAEEALTFGPEGLLARLPAGAIHLCMSTIGVETSRKLAAAHEERGQGYVAAPVFGRPGAAASRHLWIVAGGPEAQVTRCLTIFDALGRGLTRVGPLPEVAHAAKLGGSLLTVAMVEGLSEVLAFGEKAGLAPADFLRLLNTALFKSPLLDSYGGLMVRHSFEPADLSLDQAAQDTRLALRASEGLKAALPLAELLHRRLEVSEAQGLGAQDLSVLYRACRMEAGLEAGLVPRPQAVPAPPPSRPEEVLPTPVLESRIPPPATLPPPTADPVPPEGTPEMAEGEAPGPAHPPIVPLEGEALSTFAATSGDHRVILDLKRTTHFEELQGQVWAWHQEKRYGTPWRSLAEVEGAFRHILFLRVQRHVLLHPETVLALRPLFGGRAKARVGEHLELEVSRAATPRLKELLGW